MTERRKQMANEETGKAIPYAQWKKEQAEYYKKMEQRKKHHQGLGELEITEADEYALDETWDKRAEKLTEVD